MFRRRLLSSSEGRPSGEDRSLNMLRSIITSTNIRVCDKKKIMKLFTGHSATRYLAISCSCARTLFIYVSCTRARYDVRLGCPQRRTTLIVAVLAYLGRINMIVIVKRITASPIDWAPVSIRCLQGAPPSTLVNTERYISLCLSAAVSRPPLARRRIHTIRQNYPPASDVFINRRLRRRLHRHAPRPWMSYQSVRTEPPTERPKHYGNGEWWARDEWEFLESLQTRRRYFSPWKDKWRGEYGSLSLLLLPWGHNNHQPIKGVCPRDASNVCVSHFDCWQDSHFVSRKRTNTCKHA